MNPFKMPKVKPHVTSPHANDADTHFLVTAMEAFEHLHMTTYDMAN